MTDTSRKHILITGASGIIGQALSKHLAPDYTVHALSRRDPHAAFYYDQANNKMQLDDDIQLHGVINLAGANISEQRWSERRKREIVESRTLTTAALSKALAALTNKPEFLLSASAIGYYGCTGSETVDEHSPPANDFLGTLSQQWEQACAPAEASGIRCVQMRLGLVLSPEGGVLKNFILPLRLATVGQLGKGQHYMSWIGIDDLLLIISALMQRTDFHGPINCVAPNAVTNSEFMAQLAKTLHRPKLPALPVPMIRLLFGEMADAALLLSSRVRSSRLQELGVELCYPSLEATLGELLQPS